MGARPGGQKARLEGILEANVSIMEPDTSHDARIRTLLRRARESHPRWSTQALVRKIWPEKPAGARLRDVLRVAGEFERKDAA